MKKKIYFIFVFLLLILIGVSSFFTYYFYHEKNISLLTDKLTNIEKSNITYNVINKENNFYDNNYSTEEYILDLMDRVTVNFDFNKSFDDDVRGEYSYYIVGKLIASNADTNNNIVNTELVRTESKKYDIKGKVMNIMDTFNIDITSIVNKFNEFNETYELTLNGSIEYQVYINYKFYNNKIDKDITESKTLFISIPLNKNTLSIQVSEPESKEYNYFKDYTDDNKKVILVICLEFLGSTILLVLTLILLIRKIVRLESKYDRKLNHILTKYNDLIVHVKTLPDLTDYKILFVNTFKDIRDASFNLDKPINYNVIKEHKEAVFIVLSEQNAYVYKLKEGKQ